MKNENINLELLKALFADAQSVKYNRNETICKQGALANQVMHITGGFAKVYIEHKQKNIILRILREQEIIGLQNLFYSTCFSLSVSAITPCTIKFLSYDELQTKIAENVDVGIGIIQQLNSYSAVYFSRFISLTQKQLHGRMADAIIHLSEDVYQSDDFELHLTRKDIAEYTAMSTESAIRIIKEFHNDRIIELDGKRMKIISKKLLHKLSDLG